MSKSIISSGGPITILGAQGMLGQAFSHVLERQSRSFRALSRSEADLEAASSLRQAVRGASVVFNCAAYTNVDAAESEEDRATAINGTGVGSLATACLEANVPLVHFSTDYVFDGRATTPYRVDHPRAPLGAYGRSKARGEELLEQSGAEYLLIRTSWVYAAWGTNFVRTMSHLLHTRDSVRVVQDQRGRPSEACALAENALRLFEGGARGTFHLTDAGECSWYEFAQAIARVVESRAAISPCTTAEFPRPAPRPGYSVLDISAAEERLGPLASYQVQLQKLGSALRSEDELSK